MSIAKIRQSMIRGLDDNMLDINQQEAKINSENLMIKDDIIEINSKESGAGVSSGISGIKINRGNLNAGMLIFDESDDKFKMGLENNMQSIASQEWVSNAINETIDDDMTTEEIAAMIDQIFANG